jgi:hypothetical protein
MKLASTFSVFLALLVNASGCGGKLAADDGVSTGKATGRLFLLSDDGLERSPDGIHFRLVDAAFDTVPFAAASAGDSGLLIVDRAGRSYISHDGGDTFARGGLVADVDPTDDLSVPSVVWDGSRFFAVGNSKRGAVAASSTDGVAWTPIWAPTEVFQADTVFTTPQNTIRITAFLSESEVPALYALDDTGWRREGPSAMYPREQPAQDAHIIDAKYVPSLGQTFVLHANSELWSTTDGETWTQHTLPAAPPHSYSYRLAAAGDRIALLFEEGAVATSVDGEHWTTGSVDTTSTLTQIAYGGGKYFITGFAHRRAADGRFHTSLVAGASTDATTWTGTSFQDHGLPHQLVYVGQ